MTAFRLEPAQFLSSLVPSPTQSCKHVDQGFPHCCARRRRFRLGAECHDQRDHARKRYRVCCGSRPGSPGRQVSRSAQLHQHDERERERARELTLSVLHSLTTLAGLAAQNAQALLPFLMSASRCCAALFPRLGTRDRALLWSIRLLISVLTLQLATRLSLRQPTR